MKLLLLLAAGALAAQSQGKPTKPAVQKTHKSAGKATAVPAAHKTPSANDRLGNLTTTAPQRSTTTLFSCSSVETYDATRKCFSGVCKQKDLGDFADCVASTNVQARCNYTDTSCVKCMVSGIKKDQMHKQHDHDGRGPPHGGRRLMGWMKHGHHGHHGGRGHGGPHGGGPCGMSNSWITYSCQNSKCGHPEMTEKTKTMIMAFMISTIVLSLVFMCVLPIYCSRSPTGKANCCGSQGAAQDCCCKFMCPMIAVVQVQGCTYCGDTFLACWLGCFFTLCCWYEKPVAGGGDMQMNQYQRQVDALEQPLAGQYTQGQQNVDHQNYAINY